MHHSHPPPQHHPQHIPPHQVNLPPPPMHPSHPPPSMTMNVGQQQQQVPSHHQLANINVNVPPPTASRHQTSTQQQQPHGNTGAGGNVRVDQNRLNHTQPSRLNTQMHQQAQSHHGRHSMQTGQKSQYLSTKNTTHFSAQNNSVPQQQHVRLAPHHLSSQPKQILQPSQQQPPPQSLQQQKQQQQLPKHLSVVHHSKHPPSSTPHPQQQSTNMPPSTQQQQQQHHQQPLSLPPPLLPPLQIHQSQIQKSGHQSHKILHHQQQPNQQQSQPQQQQPLLHQHKPTVSQPQLLAPPKPVQQKQPSSQHTVEHNKPRSASITPPSTSIGSTASIQQQQQQQSTIATTVPSSTMTITTSAKTNLTPAIVAANTAATIKLLLEPGPDNTVIEVSAENGQPAPNNLNETLANSKEKTPMCLVNELARFNKIQHQYRLTSEQGPAHKKRFTVTLNLGDEEYTADGASIKKAQHSAAGTAINQTAYKHPPAKINRLRSNGGRVGNTTGTNTGNIRPTVELNALAMKRGEMTVYMVDPPASANQTLLGPPPAKQLLVLQNPNHFLLPPNQNQSNFNASQFDNFRRYNQTTTNPRRFFDTSRQSTIGRNFSKADYARNQNLSNYYGVIGTNEDPFRVTLQVGQRKFTGVGNTLQSARHDAAAKALEVLKPLTPSDDAAEKENEEDLNSESKSPISLVHEMALKRNLTVTFEVQSEKGPPHMKTFITLCRVGNLTTEGEGNGKKISKKRSAENMLIELKKLPPTSPVQNHVKPFKRKLQPVKRKTRNLIKEHPEEETEDINPISRLIHIAQGNKSRDPVYSLIEERGAPRRREFVMEVSAVGHGAQGIGSTKKLAKRQAAENLLAMIGVNQNSSQSRDAQSSAVNSNGTETNGSINTEKGRKVKFQDKPETVIIGASTASNVGGTAGRQLVPGLLLMQQEGTGFCTSLKTNINNQTTATIASEFLNAGTSPTADALAKSGNKPSILTSTSTRLITAATTTTTTTSTDSTSPTQNGNSTKIAADVARPKDQLLYLAQLLGFEVHFSDFPKGNHGEYLTLITLTTEPPQLCHGAGNSTDASHDQAALKALQILSTLGLDNVVKPKPNQEEKKLKPILSNGVKK